jgi:hypothetical protein
VPLLAAASAGCSDSEHGRLCELYACGFSARFPEGQVSTEQATQVDAHFCFNDDCRDGVIDLVRSDNSSPCVSWPVITAGDGRNESSVCLTPGGASGVYQLTAIWEHLTPEKPANGSTYTLTLRDHASNAVLFARTATATYVDGPNPDGCHPACWSAQLSSVDSDADAGSSPAAPPLEP